MSRLFPVSSLAAALLLIAGAAGAHPLAPALLYMEQAENGSWQVLWRHSRLQSSKTPPQPVFPAHCEQTTPVALAAEPGAAVAARWTLQCNPAAFAGGRLVIDGLAHSPINVIVRLRDRNGAEFQTLLDADRTTLVLPEFEQAGGAALRYLKLGIEHLVFGPDHLLFLLALLLLVSGVRALVLTITAFTLGHSITLSLAALGVIQVPAAVMELGIALSLVVVARELLGRRRSWLGRNPAGMALGFGLLHGLGFAGALGTIGLPAQHVVPALLAFNVGIELGQLLIILIAGLLYLAINKMRPVQSMKPAALPVSAYLIGTTGVFWCLDRSPAALHWAAPLVS